MSKDVPAILKRKRGLQVATAIYVAVTSHASRGEWSGHRLGVIEDPSKLLDSRLVCRDHLPTTPPLDSYSHNFVSPTCQSCP
jgi:hypothetical protein